MADSVISVEYKGRIATITISNEKKLNALNQQQYYDIAKALREIATHDEVYITVLLAKGRYFSAYACLTCSSLSHSAIRESITPAPPSAAWLTLALSHTYTVDTLLSSNLILQAHLTLRLLLIPP
jgi:peroxisomal 3,2-trans-enoyl-CoA isomerase